VKTIRLCYRKIIDASCSKAWDRAVFDDTHLEFYLQAQRMDPEGRFPSFRELAEALLQADQLHYLTSTAAIGYIRQLNDLVPDIANVYGKLCVPFKNFKFEIIQSHTENKSLHRIAIWFYSEPMTLIDHIGNKLLISYMDKNEFVPGTEIETEMIELVPYLSVSHFIPQ
jgi:hypothetical protein